MSEVTNRLRSAEQRVSAARLLLERDFTPDAMSRLYFGILEASRALLLLHDVAPKTHKGIGMKLSEHFRGNIDIGLLVKLRQNREEADYNLRIPSEAQVEDYLGRADKFIEAASRRISMR